MGRGEEQEWNGGGRSSFSLFVFCVRNVNILHLDKSSLHRTGPNRNQDIASVRWILFSRCCPNFLPLGVFSKTKGLTSLSG